MIEIGKYNDLRIVKRVPFGMYLDGQGFEEILLPTKYVPKDAEPGMDISVFLYLDSEDRLIATTKKPYAEVGQYAILKVVSNTKHGSFADWGLEKDIFIPFREQRVQPEVGNSYLTYVYFDENSGRIAGSHLYYKYLDKDLDDLRIAQEVSILVFEQIPIGYRAIIDGKYVGLLYKDELFNKHIRIGDKIDCFIKKIREDGKIDLSLAKPGFGAVVDFSDKVIELLIDRDGFIALTDKSSPELIYDYFGVSKKVFKKAIGTLYKQRRILIAKDGIELVKK